MRSCSVLFCMFVIATQTMLCTILYVCDSYPNKTNLPFLQLKYSSNSAFELITLEFICRQILIIILFKSILDSVPNQRGFIAMGFIYPGPTAWPTSTSVNTEPTTVMQIIEVQTILSDVNKFITDIKMKISSLPVKSRRNVLRSFATILSEVENLIYYIFIRLDRDKKNVFTDVSTSGDECRISANQDPDFPAWTNQKAVFAITNQEEGSSSSSRYEAIITNNSNRIEKDFSKAIRTQKFLKSTKIAEKFPKSTWIEMKELSKPTRIKEELSKPTMIDEELSKFTRIKKEIPLSSSYCFRPMMSYSPRSEAMMLSKSTSQAMMFSSSSSGAMMH